MNKKIIYIASLSVCAVALVIVSVLLALSGGKNAKSVSKTYVNDEFHAIVEYSDGTKEDLGYVGTADPSKNVTVTRSYVDENLHAIVEFSDGTKKDLGYVGTVDTSKNVTVTKSYVDEDLHAIVEFSDGTKKDLGYVGTVDTSKNVTVTKSYVDENLHAIVEFSDGTKKDLGYVGVEVEPPIYKVTFVDKDGKVIDTQDVYKGKDAKAPAAPEVADMVFSGWDRDFTNVQGNITVTAQYSAMASFKVTFKDELGNVLKTETVIVGRDATAPTPPTREDYIFTGWDRSYKNVTSDITVTAKYRAKNTYTVTFKDYSGLVLGTQSVKEGSSTSAPVTPVREGYTFTGWSSSLNNITSNKTVTAQYRINAGNNIFDISYVIGSDNTVTVTYAIKGTVKFCGIEGSVKMPTGVTYKSHTVGEGTIANCVGDTLYFTMTSNSGTNITRDITLMTVVYTYSDSVTSADFTANIADIFDQNNDTVSVTVIGEEIKLK